LKCPICFTLAEMPYESNCCGNIFCDTCVGLIRRSEDYSKCPICRKNVIFRESSFAKRLLTNLVVKCMYKCGENLLFHKMKIHLKTCPEREFVCKIDPSCQYKSKKDDFLKHVITAHPISILSVSENFDKVKEVLPEVEEVKKPIKKEIRVPPISNFENLIVPSYNFRDTNLAHNNTYANNIDLDETLPRPTFDNDPFRYEENPYLDRRTFRNYLFRRKLIKSEKSSSKDDVSVNASEIADDFDHDESVSSTVSPNINTIKTNALKPLVHKSERCARNDRTDLFKYYYDNKHESQTTEDINIMNDEFDCAKLYNQLVNQNMLLKTEILDKIKRTEDGTNVYENNKVEEEEKEIEGKKQAINKILKSNVKSGNENGQLVISSNNTTTSLYNNESNKNNI